MKQIEPISIWDNGKTQNAEIINTYGTHLSLGKLAQFYYVLYTKDKQVIATGSVKMDGEDYQKWSSNDDYAWEFVATKLNLVIVGDWVEPIVEPIVKESLTVEFE